MFGKARVRTYKQSVITAVIIALVLFMLVYMAVQFSRGFSMQVSTQRTQTVTDKKYIYLSGYIFRDESVIVSESPCIVDYLVANGEKVGVGQAYADLYSSPLPSDQLSAKQAELDGLTDRIRLIEAGIEGGKVVSDLALINENLLKSYYSYVNFVQNGDLEAADKSAEVLLSAMVDYSVVTGGEASKNISAQLKAQKSELLSSVGTAANTSFCDIGFNFFRKTDGYESVFSSSRLDGLTPDGLSLLAESDPEAVLGQIIGKRVYTPKWYIALPANEATYLQLEEGSVYDVCFSDGKDVTLDMKLERICIDEGDADNAYLLFSSYDISLAADFSRTQNVKILLGRVSLLSFSHLKSFEKNFN